MKRKKLLHIDSVRIHFMNLQGFQYFLKTIWEDVEILDMRAGDSNYYKVELSMPENVEGSLIMHLWEDWASKLMNEMYAALN